VGAPGSVDGVVAVESVDDVEAGGCVSAVEEVGAVDAVEAVASTGAVDVVGSGAAGGDMSARRGASKTAADARAAGAGAAPDSTFPLAGAMDRRASSGP
jgi:hypothetical protein